MQIVYAAKVSFTYTATKPTFTNPLFSLERVAKQDNKPPFPLPIMEASLDQIKKTKKPTQNDAVRGNEGVETLRVWDCGSPLYDVHELVSVSFIIEKHLMLLPGASDSKRFKAHLRAPAHKVAKAVTVVGSEIIDGCGGGRGGGCGWMLVKKWRCNKKVSKYKLKKSFARLI